MPKPGPRTTYRYNDEFKATAVRLSELPGVAIKDVAESLCIHPFMLSLWRKKGRTESSSTSDVSTQPFTHEERTGVIAKFVVAGLIAIMVTWFVYFVAFGRNDFVLDPAAWGQLGDIVGGVLNPVLSFLTLFMLALSLVQRIIELGCMIPDSGVCRERF